MDVDFWDRLFITDSLIAELLHFYCMLPLSQGIMNQNIEFWIVSRSYTFLQGLSVNQVAGDWGALVVFRQWSSRSHLILL